MLRNLEVNLSESSRQRVPTTYRYRYGHPKFVPKEAVTSLSRDIEALTITANLPIQLTNVASHTHFCIPQNSILNLIIRAPKPETLNPRPETLNPRP